MSSDLRSNWSSFQSVGTVGVHTVPYKVVSSTVCFLCSGLSLRETCGVPEVELWLHAFKTEKALLGSVMGLELQ